MCEFSNFSILNVYGLAMLVKRNSAYLFHLDMVDSLYLSHM